MLLTTDDRFLHKAAKHGNIIKVRVESPILWLMEVTKDGESGSKSGSDKESRDRGPG